MATSGDFFMATDTAPPASTVRPTSGDSLLIQTVPLPDCFRQDHRFRVAESGRVSKEERAVTIVELVTQTMSVLNDGEKGELAVCHGLAKATASDAAVLIGTDFTRRVRVHAVWPNHRAAAPLAELVVAAHGHPAGDHPVLGEVLTLTFGAPNESHPHSNARTIVLSRRARFTPEARMFLTEAGPALQLLLPHVGDACLAAEQSRAAADAAAALNLTSREVEVLQLLSEGLLARTIAARLGLSPRTVHKHLSNVYTKLGVHDRLVAVSFARDRGLISA